MNSNPDIPRSSMSHNSGGRPSSSGPQSRNHLPIVGRTRRGGTDCEVVWYDGLFDSMAGTPAHGHIRGGPRCEAAYYDGFSEGLERMNENHHGHCHGDTSGPQQAKRDDDRRRISSVSSEEPNMISDYEHFSKSNRPTNNGQRRTTHNVLNRCAAKISHSGHHQRADMCDDHQALENLIKRLARTALDANAKRSVAEQALVEAANKEEELAIIENAMHVVEDRIARRATGTPRGFGGRNSRVPPFPGQDMSLNNNSRHGTRYTYGGNTRDHLDLDMSRPSNQGGFVHVRGSNDNTPTSARLLDPSSPACNSVRSYSSGSSRSLFDDWT
ncbi:hypothetical protein BJ875DRAFT_522240 [Amylocarpus encephaloides]|uniref:Uncharacterized protein n=1 Tax=Amylocarpus encephaloides TaxID=45428 RepID=A0A9P7Y9M1_9HELO|nr:hypothetical protein BJ875DRAFT_522240 [Amylocarpus encephaloides]